jgi:hypothetical protein
LSKIKNSSQWVTPIPAGGLAREDNACLVALDKYKMCYHFFNRGPASHSNGRWVVITISSEIHPLIACKGAGRSFRDRNFNQSAIALKTTAFNSLSVKLSSR